MAKPMTLSQGIFWALAFCLYWTTTTTLEFLNPHWRLPDWGM